MSDHRVLSLKVLTFNVFHDYPFFRHFERRLKLLEDGLAAERPDVAILQEVSVSHDHGHLTERLVEALGKQGFRLRSAYAAANGSIKDGGSFEEGSAVLSRWPIVAVEARRLAADHLVERESHGYRFQESRIALRATIEVAPDVRLDVFGAHVTDFAPAAGASARRLQIEDLARFVVERPEHRFPAVIGGDFNARPESDDIGWLCQSGFEDLCVANEPGLTNDANDRDLEGFDDTSDQRIDYLFVAGAAQGRVNVRSVKLFLAKPAEVQPGRFLWASDHSGIVAEIEIRLDR
ncbi:MAG: endonuclease/exonuclease/phosphatase family protein [Candidatus Binatia bacterium]